MALLARSSITTEGSAEINNKIRLSGNGKLISTALSRLATRKLIGPRVSSYSFLNDYFETNFINDSSFA